MRKALGKRAGGKVKTIPWRTVHREWMKEPEYRAAYEAAGLAARVAMMLVEARSAAGFTQEQVAQRMNTKQSVVARLEAGKRLPSMTSIQRYAEAIGRQVRVELR
jgi:ribosome-binding protein aMBF1 (putative translation factor)